MRRLANICRLVAVGGALTVAGSGCGSASVDSGGLSRNDRNEAQIALNALQGSNISTQLVALTATAGQVPAACQVHLVSRSPATFKVYIFWIPYVGPSSYSWITMLITKDGPSDKFHLGTQRAVFPGGLLVAGGGLVPDPLADYDSPLSRYGPQQIKINHRVLMAHAGDVFSKPRTRCQVLMNGYLKLLPNPPG